MFSKKPAPQTRISAPKPVAGGSTFSVIGADVVIKGDIHASADLHVDGRVEGDIACAALVQGESSSVMGAIEAESACLAGHVIGSIHARDLVVLKTARIEGDVHYDALTIEQGAEVEGRFSHRMTSKAKDEKPVTAPSDDGGAEPKLTLAN